MGMSPGRSTIWSAEAGVVDDSWGVMAAVGGEWEVVVAEMAGLA